MTGDIAGPVDPGQEQEIEELRSKLEAMTRLAEERKSQLQYLRADFDNYRKWSDKEKVSTVALANENLIRDLLVVLDDFEHALPSLETEKNQEGIRMIRNKLIRILAEYGLEAIDCKGKKADPELHEVICREPCDQEPGTILEDLCTGYQLKTKVIRPSRVKVAEQVTEHNSEQEGDDNG